MHKICHFKFRQTTLFSTEKVTRSSKFQIFFCKAQTHHSFRSSTSCALYLLPISDQQVKYNKTDVPLVLLVLLTDEVAQSPNRSASKIIINVAFGTFTPTSTTVVETSTFTSPSEKLLITSSFSSACKRPCIKPTESLTKFRGHHIVHIDRILNIQFF